MQPLDVESTLLLWQLGALLVSAAVVAWGAGRAARWLPDRAARPGFWWLALSLAVLPPLIAAPLPQTWTLPVNETRWLDPGSGTSGDASAATQDTDGADPHPFDVRDALLALWLGGVLWVTLRRVRAQRRLARLLERCSPLQVAALPGPRSQRLARVLQRDGVTLWAVDAPVSAFAWRRRIVLPRLLLARLDDIQCWLLLRHEATHLRLRDPLWQAVLSALVALHWFNPGVRQLANRLRLATELRCDARALGRRKHMRRAYAEAYLEALRMSATRALACPAAAFSPYDQRDHSMRIGHILSAPPRSGKHRLAAWGALVLGASLALTAAQATGLSSPTPAGSAAPGFSGPVIDGRITSPFGARRPALSTQPHNGVDLSARRGTPVRAPADGVVVTAEAPFSEAPRYGTVVILDHGQGWRTLYAHLDTLAVKQGDRVRAGDTLGGLGSTGVATGPHVHVEVLKDGERVDPASVIDGLAGAR